jgi:hypothetical protein
MAFIHSPNIITPNLILTTDPANTRSYGLFSPLIDSTSWALGSGGVGNFSQNGDTVENERVYATDPFGNTSIVWETRTTGGNDAEGGWNNGYYNIDNTALYRFSVWVRRTSSTSGGTFYLGLYGNGSVFGVARTDNGATETNPYWECAGTSVLTQNQWYLVTGHCYPYTQSSPIRHPDTGYFTISGGTTKVQNVNGCNIGNDPRWLAQTTSTLHRVYHYYSTDSTTRLQFWGPRIDKCDGTQPSIADLLSGRTTGAYDIVSGNVLSFSGGITRDTSTGGGSWSFPGGSTSNAVIKTNFSFPADAFTCEFWVKTSDTVCGIISYANSSSDNALLLYDTAPLSVYINGSAYSTGFNINDNTWTHVCITRNTASGALKFYKNGVLVTSTTGVTTTIASGGTLVLGQEQDAVGGGFDAGQAFSGNMGIVRFYSSVLTDAEVAQNFNATRKRYGV